jgi:hypothetical protein
MADYKRGSERKPRPGAGRPKGSGARPGGPKISAGILPFLKPPASELDPGNGAREAMIEIMWRSAMFPVEMAAAGADAFLAALLIFGFKVVPIGFTPDDGRPAA